MHIIITGAAGFLGQRLAQALLKSKLSIDGLLLVDIVMPSNPTNDSRVSCQQADLSQDGAAKRLVTNRTSIIFHLAAVVSSHAEKEFDIGWKVNLDITRQLLEAIRNINPGVRLVFSSSLAVYGGELPPLVNDMTAVTPRSSYGIQKAMGELLLNDYSRKGFVDGLALRLPTICVRPGRPNLAASSFVSSIIREPLRGEQAVCPVSDQLQLFLSSPQTVIRNLMHAATLDTTRLDWRTLNLPGITVSVREMLDSLLRIAGEATVARVRFTPDDAINRIVTTWPGALDNTKALQLGFIADRHFDDFVYQHIADSKQHP
ncbi:MAG TPA: D-erythronate dehydrogenase [Chryseolinea sp.]